MEIKSLQELITNLNFDQNLNFDIGDRLEAKIEEIEKIRFLLFETSKVKYVCPECKDENPFDINYKLVNNLNSKETQKLRVSYSKFKSGINKDEQFLPDNGISIGVAISHNYEDKFIESRYDKQDFLVMYTMKCKHDQSHIQNMILRIKTKDGTVNITKIGQNPINTKLVKSYLNIYDKVLKKIKIKEDFTNALKSRNLNLNAGATTYLRRIYESIVNYHEDEESQLKKREMKERVNDIKLKLDSNFLDISTELYSLLSMSIHSMDEKTIDEMFDLLFKAVMFQLAYENRRLEVEKENEEIKSYVKSMSSKLKSK